MTSAPAHDLRAGRHAGLLVPLASIPSRRSWGIGELTDLEPLAAWLATTGLDFVQLLPLSAMADGQWSPYAAASAMAIDPIYISVPDAEALVGGQVETTMTPEAQRRLEEARSRPAIDFPSVRARKDQGLSALFGRFQERHWRRRTTIALDLSSYVQREVWWLDDHALFRAIQDDRGGQPWTSWPVGLRDRDPPTLASERERLAGAMRYHQFCQWLAEHQWQRARARAPVAVLGDFPFTVARDSADVWAHREEFRLDATVGTPPDAFSASGQDWGLPPYCWEEVRARDFAWLRARARRSAALYDGFRIDHVVGFYRTYTRPADGRAPDVDPPDETDQRTLGEHVVSICRETGAFVTAEDLGTVPDFVRASLAELGVPGYRVLRWERSWSEPDRPFIDPRRYPPRSIATSGTHDTTTLAGWWDEADGNERAELLRLLARDGGRSWEPTWPFDEETRDAILASLIASGSDLVIVPIQDLFGWRDRINEPGTVTASNWTFRLPWPVETLVERSEAVERADVVRRWCVASGRADARRDRRP